jgi:hypothetical protein
VFLNQLPQLATSMSNQLQLSLVKMATQQGIASDASDASNSRVISPI